MIVCPVALAGTPLGLSSHAGFEAAVGRQRISAPNSCPKQEYARAWGQRGSKPGEMAIPHGIAYGKIKNEKFIFVADNGNQRIQKFTLEGKFVAEWPLVSANGQRESSRGLDVDADGNVYAAINGIPGEVCKFSPEGKLLLRFSSADPSVKYARTDQVPGPYDIAISADKEIFVTDPSSMEITVFDQRGKLLRVIGRGEVKYPHGIAISPEGELFVANTWDHSVTAYSSDGKKSRTFVRNFATSKEPAPYDVAFDAHGDVYVTDYAGDLYRFTKDGKFVHKWEVSSQGKKEVSKRDGVRHLVVEGCTVYVMDGSNNRVVVFAPPKE